MSFSSRPPKKRSSTTCRCRGSSWLEHVVERQEVIGGHIHALVAVVQGDADDPPTPFVGLAAAGVVHQDLAHGASGDGEEVGPVCGAYARAAGQLEIGLVDEARGLKGVAPPLPAELPVREAAEIVVDQWDQPVQGVLVAAHRGFEKPGHLALAVHAPRGPQS